MYYLKKIASLFSEDIQSELKRIYFGRQIRTNRFKTNEPEYHRLEEFIAPGDWVIDVGANIGHYTKKMSELVGPEGRVIAFEPISNTFSLLAANTAKFKYKNTTLLKMAVSEDLNVCDMNTPKLSTGLKNYYQSHLSAVKDSSSEAVMTIPLDCFSFNKKISLIKIDVEGHEMQAIQGMKDTITRYMPILIVETGSDAVISTLKEFGYGYTRINESPNILFSKGHSV